MSREARIPAVPPNNLSPVLAWYPAVVASCLPYSMVPIRLTFPLSLLLFRAGVDVPVALAWLE